MSGAPFLRPDTELTSRLCFVDFDGKTAMKALKQDSSMDLGDGFVVKYAPKIVKAMKNLRQFVQDHRQ
jgi:aspartate aminotransferase